MKVTLKQIFQLAISQAIDNITEASENFPYQKDDRTLKILSDNIEIHRQIKELAEFFKHCDDVPFEEILCGYFGEEK